MDHEYFKDRISAWKDSSLTVEEQRLIDEHLPTCPECRQLLEKLKRLDQLVEEHSGLSEGEFFETLARKIDNRLDPQSTTVTELKRSTSRYGFGWKLMTAVASVAVLTFIGLNQTDILNQPMKPKQPEPETQSPPSTSSLESEPLEAAEDKAEPTGLRSIDTQEQETVTSTDEKTMTIENNTAIALDEQATEAETNEVRKIAGKSTGEADPSPALRKMSKSSTAVPSVRERSAQLSPQKPDENIKIKRTETEKDIILQAAKSESLSSVEEAQAKSNRTEIFGLKGQSLFSPAVGYLDSIGDTLIVLANWRSVRDRLTATDSEKVKISDKDKQFSEQGITDLLEAHYWIAMLSPDSSEVAVSLNILNSAAEKNSAAGKLARSMLKELEKR